MPTKHRYYLDTEFIEKPGRITLISIAIVDDFDNEYYSLSNEYDFHQASDWVKENVIAPIYERYLKTSPSEVQPIETFHEVYGVSNKTIATEILEFINETKGDGEIEFWAYYADYDWVVLCWLFGIMVDLPSGWPMFCMDLNQSMTERGVEKLPEPVGAHDALVDAQWNKKQYHHIYSDRNDDNQNNEPDK